MAVVYDPATGFAIGDPAVSLIPEEILAKAQSNGEGWDEIYLHNAKKALDSFILSVSGFRKVFAKDGNEESADAGIRIEDSLLGGVFALEFERFARERTAKKEKQTAPQLAIGIDSRPTGPAIADVMIRVLAAGGVRVRYLFIVAAPEIMAYTKTTPDLDGFVYVSASHNPIGHNGIKFGLNRGGVLEPEDAEQLIRRIRATVASAETLRWEIAEVASRISRLPAVDIAGIFDGARNWKLKSADAYSRFFGSVVSGEDNDEKRAVVLNDLRSAITRSHIGILGELNGSARCTSIDHSFLKKQGVRVAMLNDKPRQIVHRIVPEGESLQPARSELEKLNARDPSFCLGYVPDNDGDRGNLVYFDYAERTAKLLSAQEVFALACVAELAWLVYTGKVTYDSAGRARQKVAIAVNGPTSLRVDRIAEAFDARVFRAEVGEAHVVDLARKLRRKGYIVRILGEGSNGGNITHPSSVRDPLSTVMAMVKLLAVQSYSGNDRAGLFEIWCSRSGQMEKLNTKADLGTILSTLPRFETTSAFDLQAVMHIRTTDHGRLKAEYERIFADEWHIRKKELREKFGVVGWREINYDGIDERQGVGSTFRRGNERGGFKIVFKDENGKIRAFLWMRGSGTEPVFRVMADVESTNSEDQRYLLDWHIDMVRRADLAASR